MFTQVTAYVHLISISDLRFSIDRASHGGQNEDRTLLQRSQHCHKG